MSYYYLGSILMLTALTTEEILYISVGVLSTAIVLLAVFTLYLCVQQRRLTRTIAELTANGNIRVQKAKLNPDNNYAYQNPTITPGEELSKRGFSIYKEQDVESNRSQTSGPVFVEDVQPRNKRQQADPPPFLLHSIENNRQKTNLNPIANNNGRSQQQPIRTSTTNPNFIY